MTFLDKDMTGCDGFAIYAVGRIDLRQVSARSGMLVSAVATLAAAMQLFGG